MEANAGEYIKKYLHLKRFPRISLHCKLVPVQYREYEYGLLFVLFFFIFRVGKSLACHSLPSGVFVHRAFCAYFLRICAQVAQLVEHRAAMPYAVCGGRS